MGKHKATKKPVKKPVKKESIRQKQVAELVEITYDAFLNGKPDELVAELDAMESFCQQYAKEFAEEQRHSLALLTGFIGDLAVVIAAAASATAEARSQYAE